MSKSRMNELGRARGNTSMITCKEMPKVPHVWPQATNIKGRQEKGRVHHKGGFGVTPESGSRIRLV